LNLIERAASIFEELYVVIAVNDQKNPLFTSKERFEMMSKLLVNHKNVKVKLWDNLVVKFAEDHDIKVMIRGVRALVDFGYEFELAMTNKELNPDVDILFMPTDPKYFVLRSSAIKEIAELDGDISSMVPPEVADALKERLKGS
jgi:pantetheine-phosphate adenylyltransferase